MARRRQNRDKYNQIKPKVSPITYIMIGLFVFGIIFTMFMLVDTPKQKVYKNFRLGALQTNFELELKKDHNYKAISLKKLNKLIDKGDKVIVFIGHPTFSDAVDQIQFAYDNEKQYENEVSNYVDVIYYLELINYGEEQGFNLDGLADFYKKYEITGGRIAPDLIAFNNKEAVVKYKPANLGGGLTELNLLVRGLDTFFDETTIEFKK